MPTAGRKRRSAYRLAIFPLRWIGLLLLGIGLAQLGLALIIPGWLAVPRAVGMFLVALPMLTFGVTINGLRDRVVVSRFFRWPKRGRLSDFSRLVLYRSDGPTTTYAIALAARKGEQRQPLPLVAFHRYVDARRLAERIARFAGLDILDVAFDPPIVRGRLKAAAEAAWNAAHSDSDLAFAPPDEAAFSPIRGFDGDPDILAIQHKLAKRYAFFKLVLAFFAAPLVALAVMFGGGGWAGFVILMLLAVATLDAILPRRGIVFLRGRDVCYTWRFFRSCSRLRAHVLAPYMDVTLTAEKRSRGREKSRIHYCVRLDGETEPLEIQETLDASDARDIAGNVARFLGLDVRDFTNSKSPSQINELLRLKIFQSPDRWSLPPLPADTRIRMTRTGDACVFRLPARGLGWSILALLLVTVCPFLSLFAMAVLDPKMLMRGKGPPWMWEAITGVLVFIMFISMIAIVGFVFPFLRARLRRERVVVTPEGVRVESRSFIGKTVMQAAVEAITDMTIAPPISDQLTKTSFGHFAPKEVVRIAESSRMVEFGGTLIHAERVWLRAAVAAILLAPSESLMRDEVK